MRGGSAEVLTSVKGSALRHPVAIAAGAAWLGALLVMNAVAFMTGMQAPYLLGTVLLADMLVIGVGIFIAAREVLSAEHETEVSRGRLRAILDSAMDAIITVDEEQKIVLFNRAAEQLFAVPREEALGTVLDRFIPGRFREAHRRHMGEFGRTGVTSRRMGDVTTLWAVRAGGTEFPIEASISQTAEGGRRYFTVILRDISLRKQHEDALRESQRELRELSARVLEAREEEKS